MYFSTIVMLNLFIVINNISG